MPRDGQTPPNCYDAEPIPEAARAEIERLLATGDLFRYTSDNAPVAKLEAEFAELMGVRYAVCVASCSAALFLSLKALDLPRGARVLVPAFTFAAVPSAIVHADCEPVLVEVGSNFRIDLDDFRAKFDDTIAAVMISHMRGHTSDMDVILELANAKGVPVIEDAAHSLGTLWHGRKIGTIGKIGCFSFQSYKMVNAGEGGVLVTDDPELAARAIIMSGAYEQNWKKHPGLQNSFVHWQNKLPLYNTRMQNLSAAVIRPQLPEVDRRVAAGLANHDYVAEKLNQSPWLDVPPPLAPETRAPDSLQFNLVGDWTDAEAIRLQDEAKARGVSVQVFGLSPDNARAFWNWQFLGEQPDLPKTRAMLMRACDTRLPARLTRPELDFIASAIVEAAAAVKG
ncbi:DegT/DnrJ/EryC1/StrS family aminotransferase [Rhodobacter capsulatus]|jgi:dTDP-4-amino-4,6-dideoxygalactose transaminase|uniref:Aminotransferase, DegT/DnrJ/EryC1/StrS family n=1 Tax=Rhodobacter capsulatus (strain ATCC BAA-309 / NBRC 16581 / SB1003) TaxID=272942 RepID=D5AP06_RHOCB|nr:aminotransferase class I/II-fold pyridoxal phosphate-dependent enzyme [Rhodobacter capsulatus]ADE86511.1 aminotransferase, DegT/DnrJ/EryC1/StrS family [Rhodobacter capsulatus SB 1003]ETD00746.1 aminotransferase [Rhodobacter capsulatus DE442]ETD75377.1 aminotransferase [Rhodobacter capsulatus R121]ETE52807.1 aminotransferase [Rhodobacter capsulatus Y262]MDS0928317.1 aminotransferase class I/II-fold pyridoxal phosphate-dependent enzyme [Rhodobacter capsulatus]